MKNLRRAIEVWADWREIGQPTRMGTLFATPVRSKEIFEFHYDSQWLKGPQAQALDPELQLFTGPQHPSQTTFGIFLDSTPDRWGRFLLDRREAQQAREEDRPRRNLRDSDYLLGVFDEHRIGALRFRLEPNGPFLDDDRECASPPWTSLRQLEQASLQIQREDASSNPKYSKWLKMLIAPGGSLGGARPKAGVIDDNGHLWIAKFPSREDSHDQGAWEYVVHRLAQKSGIEVSPAQARTFSARHHSFLTQRFDRHQQSRRHFASALTLLQRTDGDDYTSGASYLELVEFIGQSGVRVAQDLEQLWRRIVFSMCVSNTDDHLRNHGFLLTPSGWVLSPAYDLNPNPRGHGLKLNVSEVENDQDLDLALEVAGYFRLTPAAARDIQAEVTKAVSSWRLEAAAQGLNRKEIEAMENAFRLVKT